MWIWMLLLLAPFAADGKKICPGGGFTCPDQSTCCQTLDKSYGCCPLKDAVCCDDHIHCCPANHKCSAGMCVLSANSTIEPIIIVNDDVLCPESNVTCPEDTTCCKNPNSGGYSCCPMENAVCCNDGYHCCPGGTTCDVEEQKCDGDRYITKMYASHKKYMKYEKPTPKKMSKLKVGSKKVGNVICPGSGFQCPDGNTCCQLPSGDWGCCPFANGYCCKDGIHCCPENMHCDATSQYCSQGPNNITSLRSKPAKKNVAVGINCPDKRICQDLETCCQISETSYGCCQYANATCCSDRKHCCPSDTNCDTITRRCVPKSNWVLKVLDKFGL